MTTRTAPQVFDRVIAEDVRDTLIAAAAAGSFNSYDLIRPSSVWDASLFKKTYLPQFDVRELEEVKILIAPRNRAIEWASRASRSREHTVQVCVMQRCEPDTPKMDQLMDFCGHIDDYLANQTGISPSGTAAKWMRSNSDPLYDPKQLDEQKVFRGVITITYQLTR